MWRLWSVLTLCGMPALWADVCGGLPAIPPNDSDIWRPYESLSFQLSVKPGGSAFRITVRPLWQLNADGRAVVDTHARDIEVVRCHDGRRAATSAPYHGGPTNSFWWHLPCG